MKQIKHYTLFIAFNLLIIPHILFGQNVGIGTTTPTANLHVAGNSSSGYPALQLTDSNNIFPEVHLSTVGTDNRWALSGLLTGNTSSDLFNIAYKTTSYRNLFSINANGQVGIGTITQNNWLQVGRVPSIFSGNQLALGNGYQAMSFAQYANSSTWYSNTNFAIMPNTGNGYLGIGTQSAVAPLHVYSTSSANTPGILAEQTNTDFARIMFKNSNGAAFTLAANNGGSGGVDNFNVYSNTLGVNLLHVSTTIAQYAASAGNIGLNANTNFGKATYCSPALITLQDGSVNNNLTLPDATIIYLTDDNSSSNGITITGMANGIEGRIVYLYCLSQHQVVIKNLDSRSTLSNQIINPGGDVTLNLFYEVTLIRMNGSWVIVSKNF